MSELLDRAFAQVRALPSEAQDEAARLLLDWASDLAPTVDDRPPEPVNPSHRAAIAKGLADVRAERMASADQVEASFALLPQN